MGELNFLLKKRNNRKKENMKDKQGHYFIAPETVLCTKNIALKKMDPVEFTS